MKELNLGTRPRDERTFAAPDEPLYRELATIDALTFRRMLDRVFWHPPADSLRFEVRAIPSEQGSEYTVTAIMDGVGEVWFDADTIPARWDAIATFELSWSLSQLQAAQHDLDAVGFEKPGGKPGIERMPDYSSIQDPAEAGGYRWQVINRLRKAGVDLK
ncbi:hypothetical protein [Cupriavidus lacunae]|uniref:Uncharacterized protein n=1 Tax=Cupriavidus lacunae TaxID=2666307 RepID=A0A370NKF7_9BURK|nr:hypothetical protein [Cupriavidus lacunae]RDK06090.1 hypothetical protein DN412_33270 [Cupriavidus lacunae]